MFSRRNLIAHIDFSESLSELFKIMKLISKSVLKKYYARNVNIAPEPK